MERNSTNQTCPLPPEIIQEIFKTSGYLVINKTAIKILGLLPALLLGNYIDKYHYFQKQKECSDGWFYLTHEKIEEELNISLHTIRETKRILIEKGIIQVKKKGLPAKEYIKLCFEGIGQDLQNSDVLTSKFQRSFNKENNPKEENDNKSSYSSEEVLYPPVHSEEKIQPVNGFITKALFDKFWELYPKKIDKGKTKTKWITLCNRTGKDRVEWIDIKTALKLQMESERWQDKQFIPYPHTWLNQTRWIDDPATMTKPKIDKFTHLPNTILRYGETYTRKPYTDSYYNKQGERYR